MNEITSRGARTPAEVRAAARQRLALATFAQTLQLIAERCGGEVVLLPNDRATLTGDPGAVGQMLASIQATGRLVSSTTPALTGVAGQVLVNVRLVPRMQAHGVRQAAPKRRLSKRAIWLIIAGVLALIAGLGWLAYVAVNAVMANLPVVLLIVGAVVVAFCLLGKSSGGGKTFSGTFKGKIH